MKKVFWLSVFFLWAPFEFFYILIKGEISKAGYFIANKN